LNIAATRSLLIRHMESVPYPNLTSTHSVCLWIRGINCSWAFLPSVSLWLMERASIQIIRSVFKLLGPIRVPKRFLGTSKSHPFTVILILAMSSPQVYGRGSYIGLFANLFWKLHWGTEFLTLFVDIKTTSRMLLELDSRSVYWNGRRTKLNSFEEASSEEVPADEACPRKTLKNAPRHWLQTSFMFGSCNDLRALLICDVDSI